jgi:hypothetical protein
MRDPVQTRPGGWGEGAVRSGIQEGILSNLDHLIYIVVN